jgi:hypothetical protein
MGCRFLIDIDGLQLGFNEIKAIEKVEAVDYKPIRRANCVRRADYESILNCNEQWITWVKHILK